MSLRINKIGDTLQAVEEMPFKLGLAIPHDFPMVYRDFWRGFTLMEKSSPYQLIEAPPVRNRKDIAEMRNDLVREAIRQECSHLFMMDADEVCPPDTIPRLLAHRADLVCPIVCKRYPPFEPVVYFEDGTCAVAGIEKWNIQPVLEIAYAGTGCMLIDMRVFSLIEEPWFKFVLRAEDAKLMGEDILFCHRVRQAGARLYVDTSLEVVHMTQIAITLDFHLLYKAIQELKSKRRA